MTTKELATQIVAEKIRRQHPLLTGNIEKEINAVTALFKRNKRVRDIAATSTYTVYHHIVGFKI